MRFLPHASVGLLLATLLSGIEACSSASSEPRGPASSDKADGGQPPPQPQQDAAAEDEDAAAAPDAGGACNSITQLGSTFDIINTTAAAPSAEGGTIEDGIWVTTSAKLWGSADTEGSVYAQSGAATLEKRGTRFDSVSTDPDGEELRESGTLATSGTDYTLTADCPADDNRPNETKARYTATATTLKVYIDAPFGGGVLELAYTKK